VEAAVAMLDRFEVGTVAAPLADPTPARRVKVVAAPDGRALYFSRAPIPHGGPHWLHVGVYAFRASVLPACVAASREGLATQEDLEQLAWLEAGIAVGVAKVASAEDPVDDERDLERVRGLLQR
jgi:3-deoxy-manno-octulosonate cytidylyltransferase (CMP-KDO synthetase)